MDKNNFAPRVGVAFRLDTSQCCAAVTDSTSPRQRRKEFADPIATNPFNQGGTKRPTDPANPLQPWPGFAHGFSPLSGGTVSSGFGGLPAINAVSS